MTYQNRLFIFNGEVVGSLPEGKLFYLREKPEEALVRINAQRVSPALRDQYNFSFVSLLPSSARIIGKNSKNYHNFK